VGGKGGGGEGGEMTQTLYAHMNKKKEKGHIVSTYMSVTMYLLYNYNMLIRKNFCPRFYIRSWYKMLRGK
jgi:hypothetical protein